MRSGLKQAFMNKLEMTKLSDNFSSNANEFVHQNEGERNLINYRLTGGCKQAL
ncbi:hypothetical protein [Paenibacillus sp. MMS18-CY102]|uniref:hypothetical protein n=1 Tax=Paenibacillus sp. MMS18-CY102 TaxID=2682849 RepID=UPI001365FBEB|nr:hypothetical protein [Paenibacillus sp. MMS18-CY102]MWC30572.1 hypothetical protein [Paenibacillus sp. MMS18-CY102]